MHVDPDTDFVWAYEQALTQVSKHPNDRAAQHRAVLALARMGAIDLAKSEYARFGLSEVRHHEDIMALDGRLSKDLYQLTSGKTALEHARDSAQKYEAAFQDTKGYYSGINAATMAFLAEMPTDIVAARVENILSLLPEAQKLTPSDHYFVEATRAECFLLQGNIPAAEASLRAAVTFDPLNYPAHASTLKQFKLILAQHKTGKDWLKAYTPPRALHYAGHIWADEKVPDRPHLGEVESRALAVSISDMIQTHDIGFGYGSLAAGADILVAEALLEEGAELHVVLPCDTAEFIAYSVTPFGQTWLPRFKACMSQATSVRELPLSRDTDPKPQTVLAARVAMGLALFNGAYYDTNPCQLRLQDARKLRSYTSIHAQDWAQTGHEDVIISLDLENLPPRYQEPMDRPQSASRLHSGTSVPESFKTCIDAALVATEARRQDQDLKQALHVEPGEALDAILNKTLPNEIFVSEPFACCLILTGDPRFKVVFAGVTTDQSGLSHRLYKLQSVS